MSKKKKIILVIAVLLLVGLGVGAFLYMRKKEDQPTAEARPDTAPLTVEQQVSALYVELLGREADPSGLAYWTSIAQDQGIEAVRNNFMNSPEYRAKAA